MFNGNTPVYEFPLDGSQFGFGNLQPNGVRQSSRLPGSIRFRKNYSYRVRAIKYISGNQYEYRMGGDFSWSTWPGSHTYRLLGQTITGTDLEAFVNFLANKYGTTQGSASLGG